MKQYRYLLLVAVSVGLQACAIPQRGGPPAPIVDPIRPRPPAARVQRVPVPIMPRPAPVSPAAPAAPATRVYGYAPPVEPPAPVAAAPVTPAPAPPITEMTVPAPPPPQSPAPVPMPLVEVTPPAPSPAPVASAPPPVVLPPPVAPPPSPVVPVPVAPPLPIPDLAIPPLPPAVRALVQQAEQQRLNHDFSGAAATLERALRLQPQRADAAYVWNRLARVRLDQGMMVQANTLAVRSNTFAGEQPQIKRNNWLMIAAARRQAGDLSGALEAERHANGG